MLNKYTVCQKQDIKLLAIMSLPYIGFDFEKKILLLYFDTPKSV